MKIYIVYDSEAGHTEQLAQSIAKGAKSVEGTEVFINHVNNANIKDLAQICYHLGMSRTLWHH